MTVLGFRGQLPERRIVVGGLLAIAAAALVVALTRPAPTVPILVAGADLPAGVPIGELDVTTREVVDSSGAIEGSGVGELADWRLSTAIAAGEPLLPSLLEAPGTTPADTVSIALSSAEAAAGTILTGDLVDVYVTWPESLDEVAQTELIASRVVVAAVAASDTGSSGSMVVLLEADSELAARLIHAKRVGDIDLVRLGS